MILSFTSQGCCCYGSKLKLSPSLLAMPPRGSAAFSGVFSCHHHHHHHHRHRWRHQAADARVKRRDSWNDITLNAPALARGTFKWSGIGNNAAEKATVGGCFCCTTALMMIMEGGGVAPLCWLSIPYAMLTWMIHFLWVIKEVSMFPHFV